MEHIDRRPWPESVRTEVEKLEATIAGRVGTGGRPSPLGIDYAAWHWSRMAPEHGAADSWFIEDYVAFLWSRDVFQRYVDAASPATRDVVEELVRATDDGFRDATLPRDPGLASRYWSDPDQPEPGWWWQRTPRHIGRGMAGEFGDPGR